MAELRKRQLYSTEGSIKDDGKTTFNIERLVGKTKKTILSEDYVNYLENDIQPNENSVVFNEWKKRIFIASLVFSGLYIVMGILYLIFGILASKTFTANLNIFYTSGKGIDTNISFGSYPLWIIFSIYILVSFLFLLYPIIMGRMKSANLKELYSGSQASSSFETKSQYFIEVLFVGVDWFMWFEMTISGSLAYWVIGQYCGVTDFLLLLGLIIANAVFCLGGGLGVEYVNDGITASTSRSVPGSSQDKLKINWWPLIFGGVLPFLIISTILFTFLIYAQNSIAQGLILQWIITGFTFLFNLGLLLYIFIRFAYLPLEYSEDSKTEREELVIQNNGRYKLIKLIINGIYRMFIIILFFIELFLFL